LSEKISTSLLTLHVGLNSTQTYIYDFENSLCTRAPHALQCMRYVSFVSWIKASSGAYDCPFINRAFKLFNIRLYATLCFNYFR